MWFFCQSWWEQNPLGASCQGGVWGPLRKKRRGGDMVCFRNWDKKLYRQLNPKGCREGRKGTEKLILGIWDKSHGFRKHIFLFILQNLEDWEQIMIYGLTPLIFYVMQAFALRASDWRKAVLLLVLPLPRIGTNGITPGTRKRRSQCTLYQFYIMQTGPEGNPSLLWDRVNLAKDKMNL